MRIVDRETFMAMPEGTIYTTNFNELSMGPVDTVIPLETINLLTDAMVKGEHESNEEQYGIYTPEEIVSMIETLTAAYDGQVLEQYNRNRTTKKD